MKKVMWADRIAKTLLEVKLCIKHAKKVFLQCEDENHSFFIPCPYNDNVFICCKSMRFQSRRFFVITVPAQIPWAVLLCLLLCALKYFLLEFSCVINSSVINEPFVQAKIKKSPQQEYVAIDRQSTQTLAQIIQEHLTATDHLHPALVNLSV